MDSNTPVTAPQGKVKTQSFDNLEAVLDFAIENEQRAVDFYTALSTRVENARLRGLFTNFAREEERHKVKLLEVRHTGAVIKVSKAQPLEVKAFEPRVMPHVDMDVSEALALVIQEETFAYRLYAMLAQKAVSKEIRKLFETLAMEEAQHKEGFEKAFGHLAYEGN